MPSSISSRSGVSSIVSTDSTSWFSLILPTSWGETLICASTAAATVVILDTLYRRYAKRKQEKKQQQHQQSNNTQQGQELLPQGKLKTFTLAELSVSCTLNISLHCVSLLDQVDCTPQIAHTDTDTLSYHCITSNHFPLYILLTGSVVCLLCVRVWITSHRNIMVLMVNRYMSHYVEWYMMSLPNLSIMVQMVLIGKQISQVSSVHKNSPSPRLM